MLHILKACIMATGFALVVSGVSQSQELPVEFLVVSDADIEFLTTRGDFRHSDWSDAAERNLETALLAELSGSRLILSSQTAECLDQGNNRQAILLAKTIAVSVDEPRFTDHLEGFTLGAGIARLQACADFQKLALISHDASLASSGTILASVAAAALTGFNADRDQYSRTRLDIFDGRTGQLMTHIDVSGGDARSEEGAARLVERLISEWGQ